MEELTPAIEPLSLDEAFLDLTGTAAPARRAPRRDAGPPDQADGGRAGPHRLDRPVATTSSSPRSPPTSTSRAAFRSIGRAETEAFLRPKPVRIIWGVGAGHARPRWKRPASAPSPTSCAGTARDLSARFGSMGDRLWHLARGEDTRRVNRDEKLKSISKETTFDEDTSDPDLLDGHLWRLSEQVADRAKAKDLAGRTVTLKLKRGDFQLVTRRHSLTDPTQTDRPHLPRRARPLRPRRHQGPVPADRRRHLGPAPEADEADLMPDLLDPAGGQARRGRTRHRCASAPGSARRPSSRAARCAEVYSAASGTTRRPIPAIRATTPAIRSPEGREVARRARCAPRPCRAPGRSRPAPHAARATGGHRPGRYRPRRRARCGPRAGPPPAKAASTRSITSRPAAAPKRSPSTTSGRGWPGRACASIASCGMEWQSISTASPNSARLSSIKPAQRIDDRGASSCSIRASASRSASLPR